LIIGRYADREGRRPAMMLCFVLIGVAILGMALIPTYEAIGLAAPVLAVIARLLQGFSLGGEMGATTAFLLEAAPAGKRGLVVSWQGAGQNLAQVVGAGVGVVLTSVLSPPELDAYGWRLAFLLGAVAIPFGLWLRSHLPETLHEAKQASTAVAEPPESLELARRHWRVMALGLIVIGSSAVGAYVFTYFVTYAQATLHLAARAAFVGESAGNLIGIATILLGGWLSDRYGRRPVNVWGNLMVLASIYPLFSWIVASGSEGVLIAAMITLGAVGNFIYGSFYASLAESLPASIRSSGFGLISSIPVAIFGATTQSVLTWLIHVTGSAMAPAWYLVASTSIAQVALLLMRESAPLQEAST
jgi:MFS family permease